MKLPRDVPVMTLPNATLFPQAFLPLYIFEPRYRLMLAEVLHSNRMFAVAMQRPGSTRESPVPVAGLGLIRVAMGHRDGTSHLILQGLTRVELGQAVRPLQTPPCDNVTVDALIAKVRELLVERIELGLTLPLPTASLVKAGSDPAPSVSSPKEIMECLDSFKNLDHAVDLVSRAVLSGAVERQAILETVDMEARLRRLIYFLLAEIRAKRKGNGS